MKGLATGAVALALGMLAVASPLRAQGAEFSLGGSVGIPLGNFDDAFKIGWHGLGAVSYVAPTIPVGFQVDGNYAQFSDESSLDIKDQIIFGTGNVVYKFKSSPETRFRPYIIGGGGVYNIKPKGSDVPSGTGSTTKFGLNGGAGFDFKAGTAGLFIEGRFHDIFTPGSDIQFIPITVGVRLGGT